MHKVQLRLCPSRKPTIDVPNVEFSRVPYVGEYIDYKAVTYRVVDVHWFDDFSVLLVAHTLDRPRAIDPWGHKAASPVVG